MESGDKALAVLKGLEASEGALSIDELRERLWPAIGGMSVRSPIFDPGTFVYRARRIDANFSVSGPTALRELSYPLPEITRPNRANRAGHPMFYCSTGKEPLFFELGELTTGDEIVVTAWLTDAPMMVNNIGYTQFVFDKLGAKRPCPTWEAKSPTDATGSVAFSEGGFDALKDQVLENRLSQEANEQVRLEISRLFMQKVGTTNADAYKLTTAIAEVHLGTIKNMAADFAGVMYPSIKMSANGDNIALTPKFVDAHLKFKRATRVRIDKHVGAKFDFTSVDCAKSVDVKGNLEWLGRLPNWQVKPGQMAKFTVTPGRDSDGEYSSGKDGAPLHWLARDATTGEIIEPA